LVSEEISPAPLAKGTATKRSPTRPMAARKNSSSPSLEGTSRAMTAAAVGRCSGSQRQSQAASGLTSSSKQTMAETG